MTEDGKPQKISTFEFQKLAVDPEPPEAPPSLEDQRALPEDPKTTITLPSHKQIQYHDKRLLVLFFDFSNMGIPEQLRAQDAALKYVNTQMTESDLMAILIYTTAVQVKTDFTANREQLEAVIKAFPIGEMSEMAGVADTGDDNNQDTGAAFVADETEFNIFNTDQKLAAIEDVVHKLSALPEKKVLVYITNGISKTGIENQAQLEASINAAVKANVAIYPIDARGLMADPPGGGASTAASRGSGIFNGSVYNSQRAAINDSQETLSTLASETGGKVFLDSNDLSLGIVQAKNEFRSYYILGYYTTNGEAGRQVPQHHGEADQQEHLRQAGFPPRLFRRQGLGQIQRRRQGTAVAAGALFSRSADGFAAGARSRLFPHLAGGLLRAGLGQDTRFRD